MITYITLSADCKCIKILESLNLFINIKDYFCKLLIIHILRIQL